MAGVGYLATRIFICKLGIIPPTLEGYYVEYMKQHVISMKEGTLSGYGQHLAPFLPHSRCSISFGCTSYIRCIPLRLAFLPFPVGMLNLEHIPGYSGPTHAFMDSPQPQPPGRLRCYCRIHAVQTGWYPRGKWAGTFNPKDPKLNFFPSWPQAKMHAQKWL